MGFWDNSLRIFKCLCDNTQQSVRQLARQTGLSKSSVHRLTQAMERRNSHPESWWWETAEGRQWLTRLVVATLYTFGLKRGVGLETMHEFFARLHLATQVGCSPSALRRVMQTLEAALLETASTWEQEGSATPEGREIIGAVDETFLERMVLVLLDLPPGYVVLETAADDRSYATWHALVEKRLTTLGAQVRYLVSDRAKALIQLAEQGLECLSMPDFFHLLHDIVKSYSLAIGRRLTQAHQEWHTAKERLQKHQAADPRGAAACEVTHQVETKHAEVTRWEAIQHEYRQRLANVSLALHPFSINDSAPQTSAQVEAQLHAQVAAIAALAATHQLPARPAAMTKVKKQLPALAALVDFWWAGVEQDLEQAARSAPWRRWARELLLPWVYWEYQVARTRCAQRKAKMQRILELIHTSLPPMRSLVVFLRRPWRTGKPGPRTRYTLFNAPHQPWRGATVASRNCITISAACLC